MNAPAWLLVIRWLAWDTFRQSLASRIFWVMLGVSVLCIVFCLSTSFANLPAKPTDGLPAERLPASEAKKIDPGELSKSGVDAIDGELRFLFGAVRVPYAKHREDAVRWLQLILAGFVADTLGLLLALIWTAAFLPTFLEPSAVTVLLAKPVPRWSLLAGKFVGVLLFVTFQAIVFVGGTWLALAVRGGDWSPHYLWCVPVLVLHFAIFFSFSCMLAVWTRSTIVCVFASLLFWFVCWGMNYGRHAALAGPIERGSAAATSTEEQTGKVTNGFSTSLEAGYWVLPKPADMGLVLRHLLKADDHIAQLPEFAAVEKQGQLNLELSVLASCLFGFVMLAVAGYEFVKAEY